MSMDELYTIMDKALDRRYITVEDVEVVIAIFHKIRDGMLVDELHDEMLDRSM